MFQYVHKFISISSLINRIKVIGRSLRYFSANDSVTKSHPNTLPNILLGLVVVGIGWSQMDIQLGHVFGIQNLSFFKITTA